MLDGGGCCMRGGITSIDRHVQRKREGEERHIERTIH